MCCVRLAVAVTAGLLLAAPAQADPASDAAAWLNGLGVHDAGKAFTPESIKTATEIRFFSADFAKLKAGDIEKLSALPMLENVSINDRRVNDDLIVAIAKLPNPRLKMLNLDSVVGLSRRSLAAIGQMPTLEALTLNSVAIDDEIEELAAAPRLTDLFLARARFTDRGGVQLGKLKHLRTLVLMRTAVTDASMPIIGNLPALQGLILDYAAVTGDGLKHLANAKRLAFLSLNYMPITDADIAHLAAVPALKQLMLRATLIGDVGLIKLAEIQTLKILYMANTRITDDGIRQFKVLRPNTEIKK